MLWDLLIIKMPWNQGILKISGGIIIFLQQEQQLSPEPP